MKCVVKLICNILIVSGIAMNCGYAQNLHTTHALGRYSSGFIENRGQVTNQLGIIRDDVLYIYEKNGVSLFLTENGYSILIKKLINNKSTVSESDAKVYSRKKYDYHRVDVVFRNKSENMSIRADTPLQAKRNYYLSHTPEAGVKKVKSFKKILYKNVYENIDIEFMIVDAAGEMVGVKYNVIVKPGGKLDDVNLEYKGQTSTASIGNTLELGTSLGSIQEKIPVSYITNGDMTRKIKVEYRFEHDNGKNIINFNTESNHQGEDTLVVDPVFYHTRKIGTYFGDDKEEESYGVATDSKGDVYIVGRTNSTSNIATSGAHQGTLGASTDAFIAKFGPKLEVLSWATYFGGKEQEVGRDIYIDEDDEVFITGETMSGSGIATTLAHQTSLGATNYLDGFLARFDSTGSRDWSTYYGGNKNDMSFSVSASSSLVVIAGETISSNGRTIAKRGGHQTSIGGNEDGFVATFNKNGVRQWSTYYGGSSYDRCTGVALDNSENVYVTGYTESTSNIATSNTHQTSHDDDLDGFLVKFNKSGSRQWGTYFGDEEDDLSEDVDVNSGGTIIYVGGSTESTSGISTSGTHQGSKGSGSSSDAFVMRFNGNGTRNWGSYFGGNGIDEGYAINIDRNGSILLTGKTESRNNIASTTYVYQATHGGTGYFDGYLVKFKPNGGAFWSTYYGIQQEDVSYGVTSDKDGYAIISGFTRSSSDIATANAFLTSQQGGNDAFIAKFCDIIVTTQPKDQYVWLGNTAIFNVKHIGTDVGSWNYEWYKDGSKLSGGSKLNLIINDVDSADEGYYVLKISNDCGILWTDSAKLSIHKYKPPKKICRGGSAVIELDNVAGATYSWSPSTRLSSTSGYKVTASPYKTTSYTVIISSSSLQDTLSITVDVKPIPDADAGVDVSICSGKTAQLGSSGCTNCTYSWSPNIGLSSNSIANPTVSRKNLGNSTNTHTYKITTSLNGCDSTDEVNVRVFPLPNVSAGSNRTVCVNDNAFNLSGSPSGGTWRGAGITDSTKGTFDPAVAGSGRKKISYHFTDNNGCTDSNSLVIRVNDKPAANAGKDTFFCKTATSVSLAGKPSSGTWSGHKNVTSSGVFNPKSAGNGKYELYYTVTNSSNCKNIDTVVVEVGNITNANAGNDIEVCLNDPEFSLSGSSPSGGSWSGKGVANGKFDPKSAGVGKHKVTYTIGSGTCKSDDERFVTVHALPNISLGNDIDKCLNDPSFDMKSFSPSGGDWKGTAITDTIKGTFSPGSAGKGSHYAVYKVTNSNGCTAKDSIKISVSDTPQVEAKPMQACDIAGIIQLSGSPSGGDWAGSSYVKANGKFDAKSAGPGNYIVHYTVKKNGCSSRDTALITIISPQSIDAGADDTLCLNANSITLKGKQPSSGGTWSGKGVSNGSFNPSSAGVGRHKLTFTIGQGTCVNSDDKYIVVHGLPSITLGNDLDKCLNSKDFNISSYSPSGGTWSGAGITNVNNATFSPSKVGTGTHYASYQVTDNNGCTNKDSIKISVLDTPSVNASPAKACDIGGVIQLSGSPSGGDWSGSKYVKANGKFDAKSAGTGSYIVSYTVEKNGCYSTDTALVSIISPQSINAGVNDTFCINDASITLKPVQPTSGGTWSGKGVSGASFSPANAGAGTHQIIYSIGKGTCLNRDTINMVVNALPTVSAGSDINACERDDSFAIKTQYPSGGTWSGKGIKNANRGLFYPDTAGIGSGYLKYTYTDGNGCKNEDSLEVTVNPLPVISAPDTQVCSIGGKVQLKGSPSYGQWSGHRELTLGGIFNVTKAGVNKYSLVFTAKNTTTGCTDQDTVSVDVITPKRAKAGVNDTFCITDADVDLHGLPAGGSWSGKGMTDSTFSPNKAGPGSHFVYYTYGSGTCENTDTVLMVVHDLPKVEAGPKADACISNDSLQLNNFSPSGGKWRRSVFHDTLKGIFNPKMAGVKTHTVVYHVTDANGCENLDSTEITVYQLPSVSVSNSLLLCNQPLPVQLQGSPKPGVWRGKNVSNDSIYTPNGVDTHFVYYTHTNQKTKCKNTDSTLIQVTNPEYVYTDPDTAICRYSDSIQLGARPSGGNWMGTNISRTGWHVPLDTGMHPFVYTKGTGTCQTYDTLDLYVIPLPIVNAGPTLSNCIDDDTFQIDSTTYGPGGGVWKGLTIIDSLKGNIWPAVDTPQTSGLYYAYTHPKTGCTNFDSTNITVHPLPVVKVGDTTICNQAQASQFYGTPANGTWSQNGITSSGSFTPSDTGLYPVVYTFTDLNGCTNRDTMDITVIEPVYAKAVDDFEICIYDEINVNGTPGNGWWLGPDISRSGKFKPDSSGDNVLYYSIGVGTCLTRDTTVAKVHPLPTPSLSGPSKLCTNDPAYNFVKTATPSGGWFTGINIQDSLTGKFDPGKVGLGTYTVYYHYVNPNTGCYNLDSHSFDVKGLPALNFSLDSVLCVKTTLSFSNGSSAGNTYKWNFGDGSGWKNGFNQSHTYQDTGKFNLQVIGITPDGCSDTFDQDFYVVDPPQTKFDISPRKGCGPLNVYFNDQTIGRFLTYQWSFETGDTVRSPDLDSFVFEPYAYDSITYTIELEATNVCRSDYWYDSVTVYPPPTANVHIEPKIGCTPLTVTMRDRSYGMPDKREYHLGDGFVTTRIDTIYDYTYYTDSTKTIYHFMYNTQNICGTDTQVTDIVVKPNFLRAFFELDTAQGCTPFNMEAADHHKGDATVSWRVSDGQAFGHLDTIRHLLTNPGNYVVEQMLDNGCARDTFRAPLVVHQSPEPDFTIDSTATCNNIDVHFANTTPNVSAVSWDFGDGYTSELPSPSHRYAKSDSFKVELTVTGNNEFQCEASITKPLFIMPLPNIIVNPLDTFGCRELIMSYKSLSTNAQFYQWLMNDGSDARYSGDSIQHTFQDSGVFVSELIVESPDGCVDTGEIVTKVKGRPEAKFTIENPIFCDAPHNVQFTNTTKFAGVYEWDFGDGNSSRTTNPLHTYVDHDTFSVRLFAENRYKCRDTFTRMVEIIRTPRIDVEVAPENGCAPVLALFKNNTRFADSFYWEHSDGRIKNDTSPSFWLRYTGQPFNMKMVASHRRTCFDSVTFNTPVNVKRSPFADYRWETIPNDERKRRVQFWDDSKDAVKQRWQFIDTQPLDTFDEVFEQHPVYDFPYNDTFQVQLTVWNDVGCPDDTLQSVKPDYLYQLYVPTAFAPDLAPNEGALFEPKGTGVATFKIWVYSQWGELVWCQQEGTVDANGNIVVKWDGTTGGDGCGGPRADAGVPLKSDLYVWRVEATFRDEQGSWQGQEIGVYKSARTGTVRLIR